MENTTKDEKIINVTEEIMKRLKTIGYNGNITQLIKYYMGENIKYLFGKEEMQKNDIDFLTGKNKIEIKSIYSQHTYCIFVGHENDSEVDYIKCERKVEEDEQPYTEFEIVDSGVDCKNTLALSSGAEEKCIKFKTLEHDTKDNKFTLIYWSEGVRNDTIIHYKASLKPIYAKEKDKDLFIYERSVPVINKDKSFSRKFFDGIRGFGEYRQIVTSYAVPEMVVFAPSIFKTLQEDSTRVLKKTFEDEKKRVRF